jgi:putative DNA primase/helicase
VQNDEEHNANNIIPLPQEPQALKSITHHQLMQDFVAQSGDTLRYVAKWKRWLMWDKSKWGFDESLASNWKVYKFCNSVASKIRQSRYNEDVAGIDKKNAPSIIKKLKAEARKRAASGLAELSSLGTSKAVMEMARAHPNIASLTEDWDKDPWLLNTPAGTINLRTGQLQEASKFDYITKSTAVAPVKASPSLWLAFLCKIMANDQEMVRYLQKVFGYCLVGDPKEHEMYFAYGTGRNGKGVTMRTIAGILSEYAAAASIETFIVTQGERHPTELADLRGARFVTCGETNEGQHWAEAKIKELTGGDPVRARFMRQDYFTYQPQFKLFLAGNHKPKLTNVDAAIEARFRLIPFTVTIPIEERDVDLEQKLKAEWPAILQWMVEGCLLWQSEGLAPPPSVAAATRNYLSQEDAMTSWYHECCDKSSSFEYVDDLYKSWVEWCVRGGEHAGTKRSFTSKLEERSPIFLVSKIRRQKGFGFHGIELLRQPPSGERSED